MGNYTSTKAFITKIEKAIKKSHEGKNITHKTLKTKRSHCGMNYNTYHDALRGLGISESSVTEQLQKESANLINTIGSVKDYHLTMISKQALEAGSLGFIHGDGIAPFHKWQKKWDQEKQAFDRAWTKEKESNVLYEADQFLATLQKENGKQHVTLKDDLEFVMTHLDNGSYECPKSFGKRDVQNFLSLHAIDAEEEATMDEIVLNWLYK